MKRLSSRVSSNLSNNRVNNRLTSILKRLNDTLMKRKHQLDHSQKLRLINESQGRRQSG
jgi:hypothetical protein